MATAPAVPMRVKKRAVKKSKKAIAAGSTVRCRLFFYRTARSLLRDMTQKIREA